MCLSVQQMQPIMWKYTFIRALESFPVHCLNPRPSGKRRKPAKGAAAAILDNEIIQYHVSGSLVGRTYRRSISSRISFARA